MVSLLGPPLADCFVAKLENATLYGSINNYLSIYPSLPTIPERFTLFWVHSINSTVRCHSSSRGSRTIKWIFLMWVSPNKRWWSIHQNINSLIFIVHYLFSCNKTWLDHLVHIYIRYEVRMLHTKNLPIVQNFRGTRLSFTFDPGELPPAISQSRDKKIANERVIHDLEDLNWYGLWSSM